MKKLFAFIMTMGLCMSAFASEGQVSASANADSDTLAYQQVLIWPDGNYPQTNGHEGEPTQEKWVGTPFMDIYLADASNNTHRMVVCLPGGGYSHLARAHEGNQWAPYFISQGINFVVLNYRMPYGNHLIPQSDVIQAMRYLRAHAEEMGVDAQAIGIMGHSAGGHLATTIATHAPKDARPNFQILFYPVVSMDEKYTHRGSRDNFLGKKPEKEFVEMYCNEKQVDEMTSPAIILLADDDTAVPSPNSVNYYLAMKKNGIPATLHVYPSGGHGFGCRENFGYHKAMLQDLTDWLSQLRPKAL